MMHLTLALALLGSAARPSVLYVSPQGDDQWSGTLAAPTADGTDGPLATLDAAQKEVRRIKDRGMPEGGVTVWIRQGTYRLDHTFSLTDEDSGSASRPIAWSAYKEEEVRLTGSRAITGFQPVNDRVVLDRLKGEAKGRVLQADLRSLGIESFGNLQSRGMGRKIVPSHAELVVDDQPMTLARYPNAGWLKTTGAPDGQQGGKFTFSDPRPATWKSVDDVWVHGYWTYDWADSHEKVASLDAQKGVVTTETPHGVYGYVKDRRFRFINVLEELDEPGEWYLDRPSKKLYLWPDKPLDRARVELSALGNPLISVRNASYLRFRGLTVEGGRASGFDVAGGSDVLIEGCTVRNLGTFGISLTGRKSGVRSCDIYNTGDGGVNLDGGNRQTLEPGGNFVVNCDIHDYETWDHTYRPGVQISGVGNRVANCRIHDAPHCGILLHGNEHVIEYNEVFRVCRETSDAGAFYMGRDFTEQGNLVRFNYFHDLTAREDVNAVYLDDWASGTTVYGNVLVNPGRGVLIGGGRDNTVENNVFVNARPAIHLDARGLGWAKNYFAADGTNTLWQRLDAVDYSKAPYSKRYPKLAQIKNDDPAVPKRNRIVGNIAIGGQFLRVIDNIKLADIPVLTNWEGGDPGFKSVEKRDFRIVPDSPLSKLKFKALPLEKFGLQRDAYRKTVPAVWGTAK